MTFSSVSKPIIHHITSPAITPNPILLSLPKSDASYSNSIHTDFNSQNHPSITGGLVLKPGDVWSQVVLRVIPLFNGEGHKGFIEDLNDFVSQHIHKTIADSPSKSILKLHSDITELFATGIIILNHKLQPDQLSDERLHVRIFEVWHFFFTGVLPYLEAIFLPLMSDENLLNVIQSKNNKDLQERLQKQHLLEQATTNASLLSSSSTSLLFRQSVRNPQNQSRHRPTGSQSSRFEDAIEEIDIRKLALLAFREHLCLPIFSRLYNLFTFLYDPTTWRKLYGPLNLSADIQSEQMHFKRLQMVGLLSSVQSNDTQQSMMEELSKLIRLKQANPDLLKLPSTSLKNLPIRTASANSNVSSMSSTKMNEIDNVFGRDRSGSSSSSFHPQQPKSFDQQNFRLNSNPVPSNRGIIDGDEPDDDRPLVRILEDENQAQQIKGWNTNRDFARRSIRRQLSRKGTVTRENQNRRYQRQQLQQQQPLEDQLGPKMIRPARRIRRNQRTPSISRVSEDENLEVSAIRSAGSPSLTPSNSTFSTQATERPSIDEAGGLDKLKEYPNGNA